jgi:hypothetical protein
MELQISTYAQYWNPTGAEDPDASGGVFDRGQDREVGSGQGAGFEEADGHDRLCLGVQEGCPGGVVAVRGGVDAVLVEDVPDGGGGDLDAEGGQFAVHAPVSPSRIFIYESEHQQADGADGSRPAGALGT